LKKIVITGATSGIGNLLVETFIKKGDIVFAGYRNKDFLSELQNISQNVTPFYIDMTDKTSIINAAGFILNKTEKVDTIINAAGCVFAGPMEYLSVDKIREQFEVNTFSHLEFSQRLLPVMQSGKIINISSMASFGIFPFVAPYCASKRALDILFNSMQIEYGKTIKIISIKPGVVKTPLWGKSIEKNQEALGDNKKYEKEFEFLMQNAQKNKDKGLDTKKVVDLIVKIENLKNPKPSYTIGLDAKFAEILSHLPQNWINFMVKKSLNRRIKKFYCFKKASINPSKSPSITESTFPTS
jgi:short-subunit dehydrogenase